MLDSHRPSFTRIAGILIWSVFAAAGAQTDEADEHRWADLTAEAHQYWTRPVNDRFTKIKEELESGDLPLDYRSEKSFVESLLKHLEVPAASQMLVFSTTSLQLRRISPRNPRAVYFDEELYVGWVPGGQIEIISIDPEIGGIFYIFDIPRNGQQTTRIERSRRCMNCHTDDDTRQVPGIVIKSVLPGPTGGSLTAYRKGETGHQIPFADRFGGWHLTGKHEIESHWGNLIGQLDGDNLAKTPIEPGERFDWSRYPVATSDILPHLLHEHQAGFVNRALEAAYRVRFYLHEGNGKLTNRAHIETLRNQAESLTRYLLFADETPLPGEGIEGDPAFLEAFAKNRKVTAGGLSLKDFDLKKQIFRHRCSYMIYSGVFQALPPVFKTHLYRTISAALDVEKPDPEFSYLPNAEKLAIRRILRETLEDLPEHW